MQEGRANAEKLFDYLVKCIEQEGIDFYKKFKVKEIVYISEKYKEINKINSSSYRYAIKSMFSSQRKNIDGEERDYFVFINKEIPNEIKDSSNKGDRSLDAYLEEELYINDKYIKKQASIVAENLVKAGKNEKDFIEFINSSTDIKLEGKKSFKIDDVYISVDNYFEYDNRKIYVEIDSGNMAKLIVGQYILLNSLNNFGDDSIFLIVHYYKGYNAERTNKNLGYVNKNILKGLGVKFLAIDIDTFKYNVKNKGLNSLVNEYC